MNPCECNIPNGGFCQVHQCNKNAVWVRLCQTKENYRRVWDEGRGPGQLRPTRPARPMSAKPSGGPGTELKQIISAWQKRFPWFDLSPKKGCGCEAAARWMNQLGPDGCEQNIDKILDKIEAEAKKRKLSIPFQRFWAKRMVKQAIRRARSKYDQI